MLQKCSHLQAHCQHTYAYTYTDTYLKLAPSGADVDDTEQRGNLLSPIEYHD